jgi:hypothetical protein
MKVINFNYSKTKTNTNGWITFGDYDSQKYEIPNHLLHESTTQ